MELDDVEELSECEVRRMSAATGSVPAMEGALAGRWLRQAAMYPRNTSISQGVEVRPDHEGPIFYWPVVE